MKPQRFVVRFGKRLTFLMGTCFDAWSSVKVRREQQNEATQQPNFGKYCKCPHMLPAQSMGIDGRI
jgi:hypothetical protein